MTRYGLRDDQWERIKDLLPGKRGDAGATARDNRRFVEAVLYRYRARGHRAHSGKASGLRCRGFALGPIPQVPGQPGTPGHGAELRVLTALRSGKCCPKLT